MFYSIWIIISSMYKSYNLSNSSLSHIKSTQDNTINVSMLSLHETQAESIQREIDNYTAKLEQQKRKFFSIQDTYKETLKEYDQYKQTLQESKRLSQTSDSTMSQAKAKTLKGNFDKMRVAYDETIAYNYKLKAEIDKLRRDKKLLMNMQNTYVEDIEKKENIFREKQQEIQEKKHKNQQILKEINDIKVLNQEEKMECTKRIGDIEDEYSEGKRLREMMKTNDKTQKAEIIDTSPVLKLRLKKIIAKNKETVKSLEKYQKNLTLIQGAFDEIKEVSGVQDLEEITETFVKMNQQNASLYKYADNISRNIRNLQEYNTALKERISEQTEINRQKEENSRFPSAQEIKQKQISQQLKEKQEYIQNFNSFLVHIQPELEKTLLYLANSKWNLESTKADDYKLDFTLNDLTVEQYLSDLEKFSNSIIQVHHLRNNQGKGSTITEQYVSENGKYSSAPTYGVEQARDDRDKDLLREKEFKRFAEDFIATQKRPKAKQ